jgi:hypothetical protein
MKLPPTSYRNALLGREKLAAASAAAGTVATTPVDPPAPHSLTPKAKHVAAPSQLDGDGWKVVSRKARRRRLKAACWRRHVPADLAGQCFNCFSTAHLAARCRQRTRCSRCHELGHRSFACPASIPSSLAAGRSWLASN